MSIEIQTVQDDFEDSLARRQGTWVVGDIPSSDGWPSEFKPGVVRRLLDYMSDEY